MRNTGVPQARPAPPFTESASKDADATLSPPMRLPDYCGQESPPADTHRPPLNPQILIRRIPLQGGLFPDACNQLLRCTIPHARTLDADPLSHAVALAYEHALKQLDAFNAPRHQPLQVIRCWNWVPGINDPMPPAPGSTPDRTPGSTSNTPGSTPGPAAPPPPRHDRYMAFNQGRRAGINAWLQAQSPAQPLNHWLPTASGIGHDGDGLHIDLWATDHVQPAPVENPRQTPAYRYSKRYGPTPPSFARATYVQPWPPESPRSPRNPRNGPRLGPPNSFPNAAPTGRFNGPGFAALLIGGTASVVGESSRHPGDLPAQCHETLDNLRALLAAAPTPMAIDHLRALRIYHKRPKDRSAINAIVRAWAPKPLREHIAFCPAAICRDELLVEIEGVAWHHAPHTSPEDHKPRRP